MHFKSSSKECFSKQFNFIHFDSAIRPYSDVNFDVILGLIIFKMRDYGEKFENFRRHHLRLGASCVNKTVEKCEPINYRIILELCILDKDKIEFCTFNCRNSYRNKKWSMIILSHQPRLRINILFHIYRRSFFQSDSKALSSTLLY